MIPYPKRHDGEDVGQDIPFFSSPEECRRYHLTRASRYPGQFGTPSDRVEGTEALSEEDEVPILMPPGSICVISSLVVHRSVGNISERQRRVFMPQYR